MFVCFAADLRVCGRGLRGETHCPLLSQGRLRNLRILSSVLVFLLITTTIAMNSSGLRPAFTLNSSAIAGLHYTRPFVFLYVPFTILTSACGTPIHLNVAGVISLGTVSQPSPGLGITDPNSSVLSVQSLFHQLSKNEHPVRRTSSSSETLLAFPQFTRHFHLELLHLQNTTRQRDTLVPVPKLQLFTLMVMTIIYVDARVSGAAVTYAWTELASYIEGIRIS